MDPRCSGIPSSHFPVHVTSFPRHLYTIVVSSYLPPRSQLLLKSAAVANFCSCHPSDTFRSTLPPSHHASQEHAHHFNCQFPESTLTHLRILPEAFWSVWWHKHIHQGVWCTCRQSQIPPHQFFLAPGTPSCSGKPYCSLSEYISAKSQKQRRQIGVERFNSLAVF